MPIYTDANCNLLGITYQTSFTEMIESEMIPSNSIVKLWINDNPLYGQEIRTQIQSKFQQNVFGYCTIEHIGQEYRISIKAYDNYEEFENLYTNINDTGWSSSGWIKVNGRMPKHVSLGNGTAASPITLASTWSNYTLYLISVSGSQGHPWTYGIFSRGAKCSISNFYSTQYSYCLSGVIQDGKFTPDPNWSKYIHVGNSMELSNLNVYIHGLE